MTLVVEGAAQDRGEAQASLEVEEILRALLTELPPRRAAAVAARLTGQRRNDLYKLALGSAARRAEPSPGAPAQIGRNLHPPRAVHIVEIGSRPRQSLRRREPAPETALHGGGVEESPGSEGQGAR